jgi:hypothetical protein
MPSHRYKFGQRRPVDSVFAFKKSVSYEPGELHGSHSARQATREKKRCSFNDHHV